jgi:hypothetical protein
MTHDPLEALEPCPFCGTKPSFESSDSGCIIKCDNDGCWLNQAELFEWSDDDAARRWNTRILAASLPESNQPAAAQSNASAELEDARAEAADSLRTLDAIAEYVGCPHDEELTVDHVRQHYMKLENAAQRQGIEDAGRIANAQAYASAEARLREKTLSLLGEIQAADESNTWSSNRNSIVKRAGWLAEALSAVGDEARPGVMRAAEKAAVTVSGWSASKQQYAERVVGSPSEPPGCPTPGACSCPSAPPDRREIVARTIKQVLFSGSPTDEPSPHCYKVADAILSALDGER